MRVKVSLLDLKEVLHEATDQDLISLKREIELIQARRSSHSEMSLPYYDWEAAPNRHQVLYNSIHMLREITGLPVGDCRKLLLKGGPVVVYPDKLDNFHEMISYIDNCL